jgi:ferredoxin--NADP+ reductase
LLKVLATGVSIDMFERLPAPFGLVRYGVAPDHQKIKQVTRVFDRVAQNDSFRFFGNVEYGHHVGLKDLQRHYHQVCFATGAQTDRELGIPGEDLERSHPATAFVAWYNGHPDFRHYRFDLSAERVAVVGVGNVAVDVARILCRTPDELARTDIADYALEALRESKVREVIMLGRRGPAQAAFTNPEVRELGQLEGADTMALADEVALDPVSQRAMLGTPDRDLTRKLEILQHIAATPPHGKPRRLILRFLVSPVALLDDGAGGVGGMRIVRNRLEQSGDRLKAVGTDIHQDLPVDMVFRSVGYRGIPLADVPFDDREGTIPNDGGRVIGDDGHPIAGLYVSGWIKRGPSGVIGTNKPDGKETADAMMEDAGVGYAFTPAAVDPASAASLVRERQPHVIDYADWQRLDTVEVERGERAGRPRVKFTDPAIILRELA